MSEQTQIGPRAARRSPTAGAATAASPAGVEVRAAARAPLPPRRARRRRAAGRLGGALVGIGAGLAAQVTPPADPALPKTLPKTPPKTLPLLTLPAETMAIDTWMARNGWKSKRGSPARFSIGPHHLHMVSRDDSVMIGTEKGFPLDPKRYPRIRFTVRIDRNPRGLDLRRKSGEDAAFRLFVAFDAGGGFFSPPDSIGYAWVEKDWRAAEPAKPDAVIKSAHYDNVRFIRIGHGRTLGPAKPAKGAPAKGRPADGKPAKGNQAKGDTGAGSDPETARRSGEPGPGQAPRQPVPVFVTFERDLQADFRRAFPEHRGEVPRLRGVMLKCDSNNTETAAEAFISRLELVEARPRPAPRRR